MKLFVHLNHDVALTRLYKSKTWARDEEFEVLNGGYGHWGPIVQIQ